MDLLKIIIDAVSLRNTCFLCFKLCVNCTSIYDNIDVYDNSVDFKVKTTMRNIMKYLFPSHIILLSRACNDCIEDLKKIYCKFQQRNIKIEKLNQIVDIITENVPEKCLDSKMRIDISILGKQVIGAAGKVIQNHMNCKQCDMKFTSKNLLREHSLIMHKNKSQSRICHICGKQCENPKALKSHLNCHNNKVCPFCQKQLKSHSHFNKHVKSHTTNAKRKRKINKYNCESCPYKTMNKMDLESHNNKNHLKIRPYQCETCSKGFYKKSNLTAHLSIHNKTRELICELCGSDFSVKKTLIQHLKLHEGVKDYECEFCKRKFVTKSRRNEHVKRNHSNEYHSCPYCLKKYALKKDLNSHFRRTHYDILSMEQNGFLFMNSVQN